MMKIPYKPTVLEDFFAPEDEMPVDSGEVANAAYDAAAEYNPTPEDEKAQGMKYGLTNYAEADERESLLDAIEEELAGVQDRSETLQNKARQ